MAAVLLDMGRWNKDVYYTRTALNNLLFDSFEIHRSFSNPAPLRVAPGTHGLLWEPDNWDHLQNLICSVAVGSEAERRAALMKPADIYIIRTYLRMLGG